MFKNNKKPKKDGTSPFIGKSPQKTLVKAEKQLFFDLGVRRAAAKENAPLSRDKEGK